MFKLAQCELPLSYSQLIKLIMAHSHRLNSKAKLYFDVCHFSFMFLAIARCEWGFRLESLVRVLKLGI